MAIPTLEKLIERTGEEDSKVNLRVVEFVSNMNGFLPKLKEELKSRMEAVSVIQKLVRQMENYAVPVKQQLVDRIRNGLTTDKKKLEEALESRNLEKVVSLTMKIEAENKTTGVTKEISLVSNVKSTISALTDIHIYKQILDSLQMLSFKCQHLRLSQCIVDWCCDRKYLSNKMVLSEDGLTYGNQVGHGYPAIIGNTPFDSGIMAFEVTPFSLCCKGKEGFGIIELSKYLTKYAADNVTPTAYEEMLGLFYNGIHRGVNAVSGCLMKNNATYVVKADMSKLELSITGPDCKLIGSLKADTKYVPCFSCGCRANKLVIKPIEAYNE
eukprot:TRINITY_DN12560_c0_g1_i5.p1 TRINITY_DN12560_c0_g1~~TRINITY_DN12560_c0_g1_i5.p1  ORF type:complete len:326 (-),score=65.37 TRINITY_DN12560_c0_g1_i5:98-1075(-)